MPEKDKEKTKVIFRWVPKWKQAIALFPEIPDTYDPAMCMSYMCESQHGGAHFDGIIRISVPLNPWSKEYENLKRGLENIGYNLDIRKKASYKMHCVRYAELKRLSNESDKKEK